MLSGIIGLGLAVIAVIQPPPPQTIPSYIPSSAARRVPEAAQGQYPYQPVYPAMDGRGPSDAPSNAELDAYYESIYGKKQPVTIDWDAIEKIEPETTFFANKAKEVDFKCLFPKDGQYTILIPTNESFSTFTKEMQESLFNDPTKTCMFLRYHVIYGKLVPNKIFTSTVKSLNGVKLQVKYDGEHYVINGVHVLKTNVITPTNISVHLIDKPLIP